MKPLSGADSKPILFGADLSAKALFGDVRVRKLNCAEQFRVMASAQLTWRESLRDIADSTGQ